MKKTNSSVIVLLAASLKRRSPVPVYKQIYEDLREAILTRRLQSGMRLPSTREMAAELQVSRNTVMSAFEQLLAEGYLIGKVGAGTYVTEQVPDELLGVRAKTASADNQRMAARHLSKRGQLLAQAPVSAAQGFPQPRAFQPGLSAIDMFPIETWVRLVSRRLRHLPRRALDYGDVAGYWPLREALASYLGAARGVRCEAAQIIITSGSQQGLDLTARVLLDPGDAAWIEDPGYMGARGALLAAGGQLVPVPLDAQGIQVKAGEKLGAQARLAYVTPSHQFPLGVVMSLARRLELLKWASRAGAWILEDDYDSEYRYEGRPLAALQGLDRESRVIYMGTFSKVLFPALRLGYLVVPLDLAEAFSTALAHTALHAPILEQVVLTDFIADGHFVRHIRRMRSLYASRQATLLEAATRELQGILDVLPTATGMHVIGWLPEGANDNEVARQATREDLCTPPLSFYCLKERLPPGLLLGYTGVSEREIWQGVRRLRQACLAPQS